MCVGALSRCEYVKLIQQSYCGCGFHTVRLPVYVWKAIVAAIELDFIFQRQPMPSYRSFHFDAYYNSFTQTWEEFQQPITPTCIQFTSSLPQTATPPCPTLHCTLFFISVLSDERWKTEGVYIHSCKMWSDSLDGISWNINVHYFQYQTLERLQYETKKAWAQTRWRIPCGKSYIACSTCILTFSG